MDDRSSNKPLNKRSIWFIVDSFCFFAVEDIYIYIYVYKQNARNLVELIFEKKVKKFAGK